MSRVNVAIIGLGFVGKVHFENLRRIPNVNICAVAGRDERKLRWYQDNYSIPNVYTDWKELLYAKDIHVVHNCTPNYLHYEINKSFLEKGIGVVSEKPLTTQVKEAEHLVRLAAEKKALNAVCFNYRFFPVVQQMKAMIDSGAIGEIRVLHGAYLQDWLLYDTDYNWKVEPHAGVLTRAVADIGSHWVDMAQFLTGERVTEVFADLKTFIPYRRKPSDSTGSPALVKMDTEDYGSLLLTLGKEIKACLVVSQIAAGRKNRLYVEVNGSEGSLYWNQEEPNVLWVGRRDKPNQLILDDPNLLTNPDFALYPGGHNEGWADAQKRMLECIYKAVMGIGPASFPTFEDGLSVVKVEEAAFQSSQTRQWMSI